MNRRLDPTVPSAMATQAPALGRRTLLKGLMAAGGAAALPGLAGCGGGGGSGAKSTSLGSNYSDEVPKKALADVIKAFKEQTGVSVSVNTVDHETYQEQINSYLQGDPADVFAWFAGYRMQFFAERGLASDLPGVWSKIGGQYSAAFEEASTGLDGKKYFVPFYNYPWAVFYRKSVFEERGYEIPKTLDDLEALCQEMQRDGLIPIAFADREGWPAMGTFDILNIRTNGYDFHMSLMRGEKSWESDEVKQVFATWADLLPYHQKGALGRDWLDSAPKLLNKEAGMYYLGMFIAEAFTEEADREDLDFFPFPEVNPRFGQDTIEAPIDGFMMPADPDNEDTAQQLLTFLGGADGQQVYIKSNPTVVAASSKADTSNYNHLQKKAVEMIGSAAHVTQFLDRDTRPDFASTVMLPAIQNFIDNPQAIDKITRNIEQQKKSIFD